MTLDTLIALASLCITVTLAVGGGAVRICAKLEKISTAVETLVTREECAEKRKQCAVQRHRSRRKGKHFCGD